MFELKLKNDTIQLKWGTWAMREFCILKNITIDKYFEVLGSSTLDLDVIIKIVHIGYKSACISNKQPEKYTEVDVCDWIDEVGSIYASEGPIIDYYKYIVSNTVTAVSGTVADEKKKSDSTELG
jgi:hypothetical protein